MARLTLLPLFSAFLLLVAFTIVESDSGTYSTTRYAPFPGANPGKLTHIHFYFHDIVSGNNPSAVVVAKGPNTDSSPTTFGMVTVADDPLTLGPDITSGEVGRAQGIYSSADQNQFGLLMNFNLVFTQGEFAGSTAIMYGRNQILADVREFPILGGTGAFRFAKGYAQANTFSFDRTTGDAVVEYNVYIWH